MRRYREEIYQAFTRRELLALARFYAGVPARKIRPEHGDPWYPLYKHRHLPEHLYEAVRWEMISVCLESPEAKRRPDSWSSSPRWQNCPYCLEWIDRPDWRPGRHADMWLGSSKSGCYACWETRVEAYEARRLQKEPRGQG